MEAGDRELVRLREVDLDDLDVVPEVDGWRVRHRDGRSWWVAVTATEAGERPESCGKEPKPVKRYRARVIG